MKWFIEGSASLAKEVSSLTDKAILVVNPYYRGVDNDGMIEEALKYYNCVQQGTYSSLQGEIYYYVMERK
jgi:dihydrodipicolinate synthase/N-acetylneuraminate lyase